MRELIAGCEGAVDFRDFSFSGWRRVTYETPSLLSLLLHGNKGRVFFATRMADRLPEWFGWATFGKLRQTFLGEEAEDEGRPDIAGDAASARARRLLVGPIGREPVALRWPPAALKGRIEAEATVAQPESASTAQFEFALALTELGPLGVLSRAVAGRPAFEDESFAFTGWRTPACGSSRERLRLQAGHSGAGERTLYLLARRRDDALASGPSDATFEDISVRAWPL